MTWCVKNISINPYARQRRKIWCLLHGCRNSAQVDKNNLKLTRTNIFSENKNDNWTPQDKTWGSTSKQLQSSTQKSTMANRYLTLKWHNSKCWKFKMLNPNFHFAVSARDQRKPRNRNYDFYNSHLHFFEHKNQKEDNPRTTSMIRLWSWWPLSAEERAPAFRHHPHCWGWNYLRY